MFCHDRFIDLIADKLRAILFLGAWWWCCVVRGCCWQLMLEYRLSGGVSWWCCGGGRGVGQVVVDERLVRFKTEEKVASVCISR